MAQSFRLSFVLVLVAYLGSGRAAHISLPSYHEETSLLSAKGIDPCAGKTCGNDTFCQPRYGSRYVCLCIPGDFYDYDVKSCTRGKVFPGQIVMLGSFYWNAYADTTSYLFWDISSKIEKDIKHALSAHPDGFINSTVLKVEPYKPLSLPLGVIATVEVIYNVTADITTAMVKGRIDDIRCTSCLGHMTFINITSEQPTPTTDITSEQPTPTTDVTSETTIVDSTTTTDITSEQPTPTTVCPEVQYLVDSKCVDCPFGFSGRNCSDPWLLILVIVGSILGVLLLIALILLPIMACTSSGKCCRRTKNAKPDAPRIPRASSPRSWDTNSLEMSLRQGHSNPRYVHDNGRRFNH